MTANVEKYDILNEFSKDDRFVTYHGIRKADNRMVFVKTFASSQPTLEDIAILKNEYEIAKDIHLHELLKSYSLEQYKDTYRLIQEDFSGVTLTHIISQSDLEIATLIELSIKITRALGELHCQELVHHDIRPNHILADMRNMHVKLTGLGVATRYSHGIKTLPHAFYASSLPYISPEQTGRMNRETDYRTDFYSLGVTLYQIFTGKLPFIVQDPMELIHAHIAKTPLAPHIVNPLIPLPLSSIIMKLMAKTVEERYSSIYGIIYDLQTCYQELKTKGRVDPFPLGSKDVLHQLHFPKKIYGREKEFQVLMKNFEQATLGDPRLVLVTGYPGIGKSSLIHELQKPVQRHGGFFIRGKCDQYKGNIPYNPFLEAFRDLIQQILMESDKTISLWKDRLTHALGTNAYFIAEMIPELKLIFGKTPPVQEVDSSTRLNRFNLFMEKFISTFASAETPVVIFLDDMQWMDIASVKMIEVMMFQLKSKGLLIIGSYRSNELPTYHPLLKLIEKMSLLTDRIENIEVKSLSEDQVLNIISEALHTPKSKCTELAKIVTVKTEGNPYFVNQLITYLYDEKLLTFDITKGLWTWDIAKLQTIGFSDNVVDLIIQKLQKCSPSTQQILQVAACSGNVFDINLLSKITNLSFPDVVSKLKEAIKEGFIITSEIGKKTLTEEGQETVDFLNPKLLVQPLRFSHDRVQQAAYATLSEEQRAQLHLRVGNILAEIYRDKTDQDPILDIVYHLNQARSIIKTKHDNIRYSELNLAAAKKAFNSVAYSETLDYLNYGFDFLPGNSWETHYPLTFDMHRLAAETTFMLGDFNKAAEIFDRIQSYAKSKEDVLSVLILKIKLNVHALRYENAIRYGREALKMLGINMPTSHYKIHVLWNLIQLKWLKGKNKISSIVNLPEATDKRIIDSLHILYLLAPPCYLTDRYLSITLITTGLLLTLKYGVVPESSYFLVTYGAVLSSIFDDFKGGYLLGKDAVELSNRYQTSHCSNPTKYLFTSFLLPYQDPIKLSIDRHYETFEEGISCGEWIYAIFSLGSYIVNKFISGEPIEELYLQVLKYDDFVSKIKAHNIDKLFASLILILRELKSKNPDPWKDSSSDLMDITPPRANESKRLTHFFSLTFKLQLAYLFGEYEKGLIFIDVSNEFYDNARRQLISVENDFFAALNYAALSRGNTFKYKSEFKERLSRLKILAKACPANFQHKYLIVKAEYERIKNNFEEAIEAFDTAIESAKENGFVQHEALASELFARFYLSHRKDMLAKQYLIKAIYGYYRWGANAKIAQLEREFPHILSINTLPEIQNTNTLINFQRRDASSNVDLALLFKTSQAISKEIQIEKFLKLTIDLIVQITGAMRGILFIEKDGKWIVGADNYSKDLPGLRYKPLQALGNQLPLSIIDYVLKTRENLLIDDVSLKSAFADDPYVKAIGLHGALCFPLIQQAKITGILYLENQAVYKPFATENVELIRMLTGQLATSIENAMIYSDMSILSNDLKVANETLAEYNQNLERTISDRTHELSEKNQELERILQEINEIQQRLIEQEKLVSMGSVTKSIAHAVYHPISTLHKLAEDSMTQLKEIKKSSTLSLEEENTLNSVEINLEKILEHSENTNEIIATLTLNFQDFEDTKQETDLNKLIREYSDLVYSSFYKNDATFSLNLETNYDETIKMIMAFPANLGRVIFNVIDNACYTTSQKKQKAQQPYTPTVSITTTNYDDKVVIRIWDNGEGIPKEILTRIFTPFVTTKSKHTNAGMGLSISHDIIVKQHNGNIEINSKTDEFTEVLITLPK